MEEALLFLSNRLSETEVPLRPCHLSGDYLWRRPLIPFYDFDVELTSLKTSLSLILKDFGDFENIFRRFGLSISLKAFLFSAKEPLISLLLSMEALSIFSFNLWFALSSLSIVRSDICDLTERDFCDDCLFALKLLSSLESFCGVRFCSNGTAWSFCCSLSFNYEYT